MRRAAILLALWSCAPQQQPLSPFSKRVAVGCDSEDECVNSMDEANARVRACHGACSQEREDVLNASRNLDAWRAAHPKKTKGDPSHRDDRDDQEENAAIDKKVQSAEDKEAKRIADCKAKAAAESSAKGKNCYALTEGAWSKCTVRCVDKPSANTMPPLVECGESEDGTIPAGCK